MSTETGTGRDVATVHMPDTLIIGNRRSAAQRIRDAVTPATTRVVVDLRDTGYVDSAGLGALAKVERELRPRGIRVVATGLNDDLTELFELTKFDTIIPVFRTAEEAARGDLPPLPADADDDGGGGRAT